MTDYFDLLGVPRGPIVDTETLKKRFLQLSQSLHPDHLASTTAETHEKAPNTFVEINTAFRCLSDLKSRLAHLFEIEFGRGPRSIQDIQPDIAAVGSRVMTVCHGMDLFLKGFKKHSPPMIKARQFKEAMHWMSQCDEVEEGFKPLERQLEMQLMSLDQAWRQNSSHVTRQPDSPESITLDHCYRLASYLAKWSVQIKERRLNLSLLVHETS